MEAPWISSRDDDDHELDPNEPCLIFVGAGSSTGTPRATCLMKHPVACKVCSDAIKPGSKNRRKNPSLLVRYRNKDILIDCGKTFRDSFLAVMLKYKLSKIDALILTHPHADAYLGLDDVREWTETKPLPVYVRDADYAQIARTFPYLANRDKATGSGYVAQLNWNHYSTGSPFVVEGLRIMPYLVGHGKNSVCSGFRFGRVLYLSDINDMPEDTKILIIRDGPVDILIVDALHPKEKNSSHNSMSESITLARIFQAKKVYFVGMSHTFDYEEVNSELRAAMKADPTHPDCQLAYDTLKVSVTHDMLEYARTEPYHPLSELYGES
eukprot:TRINITY_DN15570_c0_g1_i1.p1 TRINITY_DN15570_c0_g1~~TRINITY_DN15570_c0_g1_i1.p1  ORF type:complete len:325 (+),score=21.54 TRINITY_DN15570_c0_g1_i1:361-1335(+)